MNLREPMEARRRVHKVEAVGWEEPTVESAGNSGNKTRPTKPMMFNSSLFLLPPYFSVERWQQSKYVVEVIAEEVIQIHRQLWRWAIQHARGDTHGIDNLRNDPQRIGPRGAAQVGNAHPLGPTRASCA